MQENSIQEQLDGINKKLEIILEEIALQQRHRREMDDLKDDLMRIGKDVYRSAVVELEEIHDEVQTGDILYLGKKLLRNVNNMTRMFERVEGLKDFFLDFSPISRELFIDVMHKLDEFDRKGYFEFMKELSKAFDNIVTSFTLQDVKQLSGNIVTIMDTVKNLTQPDMLHTINNAISVYKNLDIEVEEKVSLLALLKQMNSPELKRGIAFAIQFLKNVANQPAPNISTAIRTSQINSTRSTQWKANKSQAN